MTTITPSEFPLNKGKIKFHLLVALLFLGACLLLLVDPQFDTLGRTLGIVGLSIFGFFVLVLGVKLRDSRPGLIVNEQGIWDNSSYFSSGLLAWSKIANIRPEQISGTQLIAVDVVDANSKTGVLRRVFLGQGLHITLSNLQGEPAEVWQAIRSFRPDP